jgi:hypothetical protein
MVDSINVRRVSRRRCKSAANAGCVVGPIARWAESVRPHQQKTVYFLIPLWYENEPILVSNSTHFCENVRFIPFFFISYHD